MSLSARLPLNLKARELDDVLEVELLDGVGEPGDVDHGAAAVVPRELLCVERGRHEDHLQVGPLLEHVLQQRDEEVRQDVPLVNLKSS